MTTHLPIQRHDRVRMLKVAGVSALLAAAVTGYGLHWYEDPEQARQRDSLQAELRHLRADLSGAMMQRDLLEGQLTVERSTRQGLEISLQRLQAELGTAHDQIAFYEDLLPPGPPGSVSIRGLDIQPNGAGLRYKVILTRQAAGAQAFQGRLQFMATGRAGDKDVTVELAPAQAARGDADQNAGKDVGQGADQGAGRDADQGAGQDAGQGVGQGAGQGTDQGVGQGESQDAAGAPADAPDDDVHALRFDQFQRSSGILALPAGFRPETVTVNVLQGTTVRASRSVDLTGPRPDQ